MKVRQIASIAVLGLMLPAGAHAADRPGSTAPPGSAAVDQYRESAPPAGSSGRKLSKEQRERLAEQGADGRELADALERNGGVPAPAAASGAASSGGASAAGAASSASGSSAEDPAPAGADAEGRDDRDSGSRTGAGASSPGAGGGTGSGGAGGGATPAREPALAESSASSTVGPFPVWAMVLAAFAVIGVAAVVRRRAA